MKKGTVFGKYAGCKVGLNFQGDRTYLLQQPGRDTNCLVIDGTPTRYADTDFTKMGYINDYFWHGSPEQNCYFNAKLEGITIANVSTTDELHMSYDDTYDWTPHIALVNLPLLLAFLEQSVQWPTNIHSQATLRLIAELHGWTATQLRADFEKSDWVHNFMITQL